MSLKTFEGNLDAKGLRFAIIAGRFNSFITERLVGGAMDALRRSGASEDDIELVRVPGSWEMPLAVAAVLGQKRHDAVICLGAVIRGETPHFDYIAGETAKGIAQASLKAGVAGCVRRSHHQYPGAGHRPGRRQGRQQGLRRRDVRGGDGQPAPRPAQPGEIEGEPRNACAPQIPPARAPDSVPLGRAQNVYRRGRPVVL